MDKYSICCTEAQTRKALELGAQPEIIDSQERVKKNKERIRDTYGISSCEYRNATYYLVEVRYKNVPNIVVVNQVAYKLPTAEQMIGFIESISQLQIKIEKQGADKYRMFVSEECRPFAPIIDMRTYSSRPKAALAAIDAALEYLSKNKK